jgi:hypothetical protein
MLITRVKSFVSTLTPLPLMLCFSTRRLLHHVRRTSIISILGCDRSEMPREPSGLLQYRVTLFAVERMRGRSACFLPERHRTIKLEGSHYPRATGYEPLYRLYATFFEYQPKYIPKSRLKNWDSILPNHPLNCKCVAWSSTDALSWHSWSHIPVHRLQLRPQVFLQPSLFFFFRLFTHLK